MALTNYTDLITAVSNWLHRTDLTAVAPDFVTLAEKRIAKDLGARQMDVRTTLTLTSGNAYVSLPADTLVIQRLTVQGNNQPLKYVTAAQIQNDYPSTSTGQPRVYAIIGTQIQFAPIPDSAYVLDLVYRQFVPPLTVSNPTNWLMTSWPNVYLFGTCLEGALFIEDPVRVTKFQNLYAEAFNGVNQIDWFNGETPRVRAG